MHVEIIGGCLARLKWCAQPFIPKLARSPTRRRWRQSDMPCLHLFAGAIGHARIRKPSHGQSNRDRGGGTNLARKLSTRHRRCAAQSHRVIELVVSDDSRRECDLINFHRRERGDFQMTERSFPPPWDIEEANASCFIVRDNNGQALAYSYYKGEPGRALGSGPQRIANWRAFAFTDGERFFFLGELEVMPGNLPVIVANLLDRRAVSKPQILCRVGVIFLELDGWPAENPHVLHQ